MTQQGIKAQRCPAYAPAELFFKKRQHVHQHSPMGSMLIVIARTSSHVTPLRQAILHIENQIVRNDCIQANRLQEQLTAGRDVFPHPGTCHSIVFSGHKSWYPLPIYHSSFNTLPETLSIELLEQAAIQGREVTLLVRGMPGHSTYPNILKRIHERFPHLVVRITFALRPEFLLAANCCLPPVNIQQPFQIPVTPSPASQLFFTDLCNARFITRQYDHPQQQHHPSRKRFNDIAKEETGARTRGLPAALA